MASPVIALLSRTERSQNRGSDNVSVSICQAHFSEHSKMNLFLGRCIRLLQWLAVSYYSAQGAGGGLL
jgi:hypothetical protein